MVTESNTELQKLREQLCQAEQHTEQTEQRAEQAKQHVKTRRQIVFKQNNRCRKSRHTMKISHFKTS
jgi:small-conductance mechanosensitive channel